MMVVLTLMKKMRMKMNKESNSDYLGDIMTPLEQADYFNTVCYRVIHNTRYYLDNLDRFDTFRMSINREVYGQNYGRRYKKRKVYKLEQ